MIFMRISLHSFNDFIFYEENFVQTNIFFFPVIVCPYLLEKKNLG